MTNFLIRSFTQMDTSFATVNETLDRMIKFMTVQKENPAGLDCLFKSQFRKLFPDYGTKCQPSLALTYIEN